MDDGGPQSLFVVLSYPHKSSDFCSILRLKLETPKLIKKKEDADYVARFCKPRVVPQLIRWLFTPPSGSTDYNMYLVPDYLQTYKQIPKPLHGKEFNLVTKKFQQIKAPLAPKASGHAVNSGGRIFYMSHPNCYFDAPDPGFECYDPKKNKWTALQPFPRHDTYLNSYHIVATADLGNAILYNMTNCELWVYFIPTDKWYIVHTKDYRCCHMFGEAVVQGSMIYALTNKDESPDSILALSLKMTMETTGPVFTCFLVSMIKVEGLKHIKYESESAHMKSRHLVHLGGDDFCLVQSCMFYDLLGRCQPIQLTRIKRTSKMSMIVTDIILHEVKVLEDGQFEVRLCFSLPVQKTIRVLETTRGQGRFKIPLNPESGFVKSVHAPRGRNTDEEGHSVYVRNWPPEASFKVFVDKMRRYGGIKQDGIQFWENKEGDCWCASAEFESADSKQKALQGPPLKIGGYVVELKGV